MRRLLLGVPLLAAGCANLLGLTGEYREREQARDAGQERDDAASGEGGPGSDAAAPDAGHDGGVVELTALPDGKLVYQRFSDYWAGDSEMFVVEFPARTVSAELGATYGLCNPLNGVFSPDGTRLVVMAAPRTEPCGATVREVLEIYELDLAVPGQKRRITDNDVPDEDPQYFADGSHVLFKHADDIAEWPVGEAAFSGCAGAEGSRCYPAPGAQSKPVISADHATICYFDDHGTLADVYCFDRAAAMGATDINTLRFPAAEHMGVRDARPTFTAQHLYYVRAWSTLNPREYIARKPADRLTGLEERAVFCLDEASDYLDPFPFGDDLVLYSSDVAGQGGPDLFVARFGEPWVRSVDDFVPGLNSSKHDVGAAFWVAPGL
jgi:hypothetical protein